MHAQLDLVPDIIPENPNLLLEKPAGFGVLRFIAFQPTLRCLVCTSCGVVVDPITFYGHLSAQHSLYLKEDDRSKVEDLILSLDVKSYMELPRPSGPIAPYTWLKAPVLGYHCLVCKEYSTTGLKSTATRHIALCKKNHPVYLNIKNNQLCADAYVQQFSKLTGGKSYFRVYPGLVDCEKDGHFAQFFNSLPAAVRDGKSAYSSLSSRTDDNDFDAPPFLAKARWLDATKGFSLLKMRKRLALPPVGDPHHRIRGLGRRLLSKISTLAKVNVNLLAALNKWKKNG